MKRTRFTGNECQIAIEIGKNPVVYQSSQSLATIKTNNAEYKKLSNTEQNRFDLLYLHINGCVQESLKC